MFEFFINKKIEYDIESMDENEEEYKYFNYCQIYGEKKDLKELMKWKNVKNMLDINYCGILSKV